MASSSSAAQQQPTCVNTFVRSVADVHKIFYAVLLGRMPLIARRLDAAERDALTTGCCYVWEDRGPHSVTGLGIERFTEGRHWSASRVRDDFLFYYEKYKGGSGNANGAGADDRPPRDWEALVKQTYSVFVNPNPGEPEPNPPKKWHLTAYYTDSSVDVLRSVDSLPEVQGLTIPAGMFRCSRSVKPRSRAGKAKAAREKTEKGAGAGAGTSEEVKPDASEEKERKARGAKRAQPRVNAVAGPSRVKSEPASPPEEALIAPNPPSAPTTVPPSRPLGAITPMSSSSNTGVSGLSSSHLNGSNIAISNVNSAHQQPRTARPHPVSSQTHQSAAAPTALPSAPPPRAYSQAVSATAQELSYAQELQYAPSPTSTTFGSYPVHQSSLPPAHTSYARSSSAVSPYAYSATDRPSSSGYSMASPVSPTSPSGLPSFVAASSAYASGASDNALSPTSPVGYYPGRTLPETAHSMRSGSVPAQQAFRPTSSLAGALDPDGISSSRRRNSLVSSFAAAAQRLGPYGTASPSPPSAVGMGSSSGSMLPPPLPPLGTSVAGMHAAHPPDMSGDVAMGAGASSSLGAALNAPAMRPASMPMGADAAAAPMSVDTALPPHAQEHAQADAAYGHAGAHFSAAAYPGMGAGYTADVRAHADAGFLAGGGEWAEQQQQPQQQQPFEPFDPSAAVAPGQPTFFTVPPHSPYAHPGAGYTLAGAGYPYPGASPSPSMLSLSSGSSGGMRPGTGYSNGRPGTGYSAASGGYAPGTPLQGGAFAPGAPLPPGPKARAQGHAVGYAAPSADLSGVTGWAGERRTGLADQASLRRFKPYAKPRDPVDEATVRALGIGGSGGEKDG